MHMGERRGMYRVLVGKPEGRLVHRWEDNIKMDLQEVESGGRYWISLSQARYMWQTLVNVGLNLQVP